MRKTYKIVTASVVIASLFSGAMQMMNSGDRFDPSSNSYGRLLADKYDQIASLEGSQGTYEHIQFFKDKAKNAGNSYNPRPMTTGGLSNTHANRDELMQMRMELERAMVGYEMRYAPDQVAGMQASYDCRLRNVNINERLDSQCKENFNRFLSEAKNIANVQKGYDSPAVPTQMETPAPVISYEAPKIERPAPVVQTKPTIKPFTPVPVSDNLLLEDTSPKKAPVKRSPPPRFVPQKPVMKQEPTKPVIQQNNNLQRHNVTPTEKEENFDPLDYVHPRLREKMRKENMQKNAPLPKPTEQYQEKLPTPSIEGTITPPPAEGFGIKPLSYPKKMPDPKSSAEAKFYHIEALSEEKRNDIPAYNGGLPDAPVVKPNARFLALSKVKTDHIATGSVPSTITKSEQFVIPFTNGGTSMSSEAKMNLEMLKQRISNNQFSSVKIIGHSDSGGNYEANKDISLTRAMLVNDAIKGSLASAQINNPVIVDGVGDSNPVLSMSSNDTRNRRVVVELTK